MISVCMATCNGERFLAEQLASILPQLAEGDELVVSDDSSVDGTLFVLDGMTDPRIRVFRGTRFGSAALNFSFTLAQAKGDLIVMADQDDIWLPGRLAAMASRMATLEEEFGADTPILLHSDLRVVDARLRTIAPSLWRYQQSDPVAGVLLPRLLVQNPVTGCGVMINASLRDLALPVPAEAVMHDWWLALAASAFGIIAHMEEPSALYRQHAANDTGARAWGMTTVFGRIRDFSAERAVMGRLYRQAAAFLGRYASRLSPEQAEVLTAFATMAEADGLERRWRFIRYRFFYEGLARNLGRLLLG